VLLPVVAGCIFPQLTSLAQ